jgi:1-acyl-sn-glycerol-3-phosphate acyltransferase
MYSFCKFIVWILVRCFYRHKIYGNEHIPTGGAMIASNHCSFLDPPLVGISCSDEIHYLARDTLFHFKPFGWLLSQLNTHPVQRGKGNLAALKMTMDMVREGKKVVIFPEGTRSSDGNLQPGQLGIGMLVQRTGCRIVPVYTHGTFEVWNNKRKFPKFFGHTACIFGTPIEYVESEANKKEVQAEIVNTIMERIASLKRWYLEGAKGSPP